MLSQMDRMMIEGGYLQNGQLVVFLAGQPVGRPGTTNLMKLYRIGGAELDERPKYRYRPSEVAAPSNGG